MDHPGVRILERPRLERQLNRLFSYPLTVIRAPMGFGKTTAMREYAQARGLEPIWLSLLGSEGSLEYCWERLCAQIRKRNESLAARLLSLGLPQDTPQMGRVVDVLCEQPQAGDRVLVVDDYDLADCPETAQLITMLAGEQIPGLHLVLLARETMILPVADLEQKGLCWVIGQEDLQFRREEISDYFALMDRPAAGETVSRVDQWTGGWITGVYLLLRGLQQGHAIGPQESIDRLLEVNLYVGYDEATKVFLQKLSFLDVFTPEQVAYILGDPYAATRLLILARGNAFISYSRENRAYQMTNLFRDFLQTKARQSGLDPVPLWQRMGRWFLERDKRTLAYDYLLRAGDTETILRDLDRDEAMDIHYGQFAQIRRIFQTLPAETLFRYPMASLRYIRVDALSAAPEVKRNLGRRLEELERYILEGELPEPRRSRILGEIHNNWVIVAYNDPERIVDHARQAVAYFQGRYSNIVSARTEFTYGAPHLLYCYYRQPGRLKETAEYISTQFHTLAQAVEGCGSGSEPLALAEYALETGDWEKVDINAQKAVYQSRLYHQTGIELCAVFAMARLAALKGAFDVCDKLLSDLAITVTREDSSVLNTTIELCTAYIGCCLGIPETVPEWLRSNDTTPGSFLFQGMAFSDLICARYALLKGDFIRLEVLCEEAGRKLGDYGYQLGYIHIHIYAAVARHRLYGEAEGKASLRKALDIAAADQVVLPFAELGGYVLPLLREVRREGGYPMAYMDSLIRCCEQYEKRRANVPVPAVSLSEREGEVLRMLEEGLKHEEIAARLFISVPTVRYHVKNIYGKLEVNNKLSALQKARSLHLL